MDVGPWKIVRELESVSRSMGGERAGGDVGLFGVRQPLLLTRRRLRLRVDREREIRTRTVDLLGAGPPKASGRGHRSASRGRAGPRERWAAVRAGTRSRPGAPGTTRPGALRSLGRSGSRRADKRPALARRRLGPLGAVPCTTPGRCQRREPASSRGRRARARVAAAPSGWAAPAVSQDWSRAGGSPLGRQDSGTGALSLGSERVDCTVRVGGARVGADQARRVVPCSERRDGPRQRSLAQQSVAADGRRSSPAFAGSLHRPRLNADVGSLQFARCPHSR